MAKAPGYTDSLFQKLVSINFPDITNPAILTILFNNARAPLGGHPLLIALGHSLTNSLVPGLSGVVYTSTTGFAASSGKPSGPPPTIPTRDISINFSSITNDMANNYTAWQYSTGRGADHGFGGDFVTDVFVYNLTKLKKLNPTATSMSISGGVLFSVPGAFGTAVFVDGFPTASSVFTPGNGALTSHQHTKVLTNGGDISFSITVDLTTGVATLS